jgi:hypothetical protein
MTRVWTQVRSVEAGEVDLSELALDVTVRKPKKDPLEFDVRTWNLTDETWSQIEEGDLVRIELGWAEADVETVCLGKIEHAKPKRDGRDTQYRLKGVDESEAATKARIADTWRNRRPDQIAADIASEIGLSPVTEPAGGPIAGSWSATRDQKARAWLDELLDYAAERTGEAWEWFAERGRLHFVPKSAETIEAPRLSYENTLLSLNEKSSDEDEADGALEFTAMLEPAIRKGAAAVVETDRFEGAYRVNEYEFKSSTDSGEHLVRGTITPVEADYSIGPSTYGSGPVGVR